MKVLNLTWKIVRIPLLLFLLYIVGVLLHGSLTDFQPPEKLDLTLDGAVSSPTPLSTDSLLRILSWNIGYAGLGEESTFFYHGGGFFTAGGRMVRPPKELSDKNLGGIAQILKDNPADVYLLQEVDKPCKRSHQTDQYQKLIETLPSTQSSFSVNYDVQRVPAPVLQPWKAYGRTHSGLATFSRHSIKAAERLQLPGRSSWPSYLFQLDRCVAVHRIPLDNGKELVIANIHNAAYDKTGTIKSLQLNFLKELFIKDYEAGNYVIAGGDWNQSPPYFDNSRLNPGKGPSHPAAYISPDLFPPSWQWIYDPLTETVRHNTTPYEKGKNYVRVIDYFLLSPNIQAVKVRCINHKFKYSDHQPVMVEVKLKGVQ